MSARVTPSLADMVAAIGQGTLTARRIADAQLERIAMTDANIGAWAHLDPDQVRACAGRCDQVKSQRGLLHGIGVGVKDIIATAEYPTEMGSPVFAGHRTEADAECVARLKQAGGYVFGKTVTTELAYFHPGKTRNPWNPRHTPGGSSSGSAAAVAAGHVAVAIGTQTNGSMIRRVLRRRRVQADQGCDSVGRHEHLQRDARPDRDVRALRRRRCAARKRDRRCGARFARSFGVRIPSDARAAAPIPVDARSRSGGGGGARCLRGTIARAGRDGHDRRDFRSIRHGRPGAPDDHDA